MEPDPSQLSVIGAGFIGGKAESVRQAINKSTKALNNCAKAEDDGKMFDEHVESVLKRLEDNLWLLMSGLERISVVHYHRFCEIGMGLPSVVKIALGWIESGTNTFLATLAEVNKDPNLVDRIQIVSDKLSKAMADALDIYKGIKV